MDQLQAKTNELLDAQKQFTATIDAIRADLVKLCELQLATLETLVKELEGQINE